MSDKRREDFVEVQLTEHGRKVANGAPLTICAGHVYEFTFKPENDYKLEVTRVLDWERLLSRELFDGKPLVTISALIPAKEEPAHDSNEDAS